MSLITATYMSLSQGGKTVLSDLDLTIERREIVTIVGPNGSGKSTLLRGLIGAIRPSIGTVTRAKGLRVPQKLQIDAALKTAGGSDHASANSWCLQSGSQLWSLWPSKVSEHC